MSESVTEQNAQPDLSSLNEVTLEAKGQAKWEKAQANNGGTSTWKNRKLAEFHDLLSLAQISGRLEIMNFDLTGDLRVDLTMKGPVPCLPDADGKLRISPGARLWLTYREQAMAKAWPGYSFVEIRAPHPVYHPNGTPDFRQNLCLGAELLPGTPCSEILIMSYGALAMITTAYDFGNPAGLLNPFAADYFQRNPQYIPLTREPFLKPKPSTQPDHD